jgi:hypothetical protein
MRNANFTHVALEMTPRPCGPVGAVGGWVASKRFVRRMASTANTAERTHRDRTPQHMATWERTSTGAMVFPSPTEYLQHSARPKIGGVTTDWHVTTQPVRRALPSPLPTYYLSEPASNRQSTRASPTQSIAAGWRPCGQGWLWRALLSPPQQQCLLHSIHIPNKSGGNNLSTVGVAWMPLQAQAQAPTARSPRAVLMRMWPAVRHK